MIDKEELKQRQESFEVLKNNNPEIILNSKLKENWSRFLSIFSKDKIRNLKMSDYVLDKNNPEGSFCYWVEVRLNELGNMHGSFALKFGLYLSKETREYIPTKKFGKTKEEAFIKIKESLIDLLDAGKDNDLKRVGENVLSPMFKGKILFLYYPDKFISILSKGHLNYFLDELNINYTEDLSEIDKRNILINFKNNDSVMKNWTNQEFSNFMYKFYRPPKKLQELIIDDEQEQKEIIKKVSILSREQIIAELRIAKPILKEKVKINGENYKRDNKTIAFLKILRGFKCQICKNAILKKDGSLYVEAAHITEKYKNGSEMPENILILCPNHHKEFDFGNRKIISRSSKEVVFKLNDKDYNISLELD